jgi:hypothetical protein
MLSNTDLLSNISNQSSHLRRKKQRRHIGLERLGKAWKGLERLGKAWKEIVGIKTLLDKTPNTRTKSFQFFPDS